jgi:hypothetical protein
MTCCSLQEQLHLTFPYTEISGKRHSRYEINSQNEKHDRESKEENDKMILCSFTGDDFLSLWKMRAKRTAFQE